MFLTILQPFTMLISSHREYLNHGELSVFLQEKLCSKNCKKNKSDLRFFSSSLLVIVGLAMGGIIK